MDAQLAEWKLIASQYRSRARISQAKSFVPFLFSCVTGGLQVAGNEFNKTEFTGLENRRFTYDYLTGFPDMSYFFMLANDKCHSFREEGKTPAIMFLDFNGMKSFNHQYGMAEGDKNIVEFSKLLLNHFDNSDCSRFNADHFCICTTADEAEDAAKELIEENKNFLCARALPIRVGIYIYDDENVGISMVCDRAKMACDSHRTVYESGIYRFEPQMMENLLLRQYILENIDRAISEGWIKVCYQPIVRTANGQVCNDEALSRWEDPERGPIRPDVFIPILEETNTAYKLDLFVVDTVLMKMRTLVDAGYYNVPTSVNFSRSDFCDIVNEVKERVDASGLPRSSIIIEITESSVAKDIDYMASQIEQFKKLGFSVWMDDYGSGYSSPIILQKIPFDLIKIDMLFVKQINEKKSGKIILTQIVKMAMALGLETIAEGVETREQAEFLKEVGCTKLQGHYYCRAIPLDEIVRRNKTGALIGFEDPREKEYYSQLGNLNLYDISVSMADTDALTDYFDTWPMVVAECSDDNISIVRCNSSFREFVTKHFPDSADRIDIKISEVTGKAGSYSLNTVLQCAKDGSTSIIEDRTADGRTLQLFIRKIADNPVTGVAAVMVVILSATDDSDDVTGPSFNYVARALADNYVRLYFVNLDTDEYAEYSPYEDNIEFYINEMGKDYFDHSKEIAESIVYPEDREGFLAATRKENILKCLEETGVFSHTYRVTNLGPLSYVNMKAVKIKGGGNFAVIAISNVDAEMKHKEDQEKLKEEQLAYSMISALSGDYIAFFTVDPETDEYLQYGSDNYTNIINKHFSGKHFYEQTLSDGKALIHPDDYDYFSKNFGKEQVLKQISETGKYQLKYRLLVDGKTVHIKLKGALFHQESGDRILVGVMNAEEESRREQEYARSLLAAKEEASVDELTGVKNKHAYAQVESNINKRIEEGSTGRFAVAVFDINGLKEVNDSKGHQEGDKFIIEGCSVICNSFKHSPVFRMGGDEFCVIVQGPDYDRLDECMDKIDKSNKNNMKNGKVTIAAGVSRFKNDSSLTEIFARADKKMYEHKSEIKKE